MTADAGEAVRFLKTLYGADAPGYIGLWVLQNKTSYWHRASDPEACYSDIDRMAAANDVYFHICLQEHATDPNARGTAGGVVALPGLWLDLDYMSHGHKKQNLPPDAATALAFLRSLPMQPTIIIHSGHGYQAYWLWDRLRILQIPDERNHAETLVRRWNRLCRNTARASGWEVDSTWDLARIFRPPGTLNHKNGAVVPVELVEWNDDQRYGYEAIDQLLPPDEQPSNGHHAVEDFKLDDGVGPPFDKFQAAYANLDKFKGSWDRTRKDMQDASGSGYDQSLASIAVAAGWTDQEVVNLLLASARRFGEPTKADGYYRHTLQTAHNSIGALNALTRLDVANPDDASDRDEILQMLTDVFGTPVNGAIWRGRQAPTFSIVLDGTEVAIGNAVTIQNQTNVRGAVYVATGKMFPPFKPARWLKALTMLAKVATVVEIPDGGPGADLDAFLHDYADTASFGREDTPWQDAVVTGQPFWRDRRLWVNVNHFRIYLKTAHGMTESSDDIRSGISRLGWTSGGDSGESARPTGGGGPYNKKYWKSPEGWATE